MTFVKCKACHGTGIQHKYLLSYGRCSECYGKGGKLVKKTLTKCDVCDGWSGNMIYCFKCDSTGIINKETGEGDRIMDKPVEQDFKFYLTDDLEVWVKGVVVVKDGIRVQVLNEHNNVVAEFGEDHVKGWVVG